MSFTHGLRPEFRFPNGLLQQFCPAKATLSIDVPEIYVVYVQQSSPYLFKIWWDLVHKLGIITVKLHFVHFFPKIWGSLLQKLEVRSENRWLQKKLYRRALFTCQVWWRWVYAWHEIEQKRVFVLFVVVCLSRWVWPNLVSRTYRDVWHFSKV